MLRIRRNFCLADQAFFLLIQNKNTEVGAEPQIFVLFSLLFHHHSLSHQRKALEVFLFEKEEEGE